MTKKVIKLQTRQISDTLDNFKDNNPILQDGQIAIAKDTNKTFIAIGDGITDFNTLPLTLVGNYGSMIPDYKNMETDNKIPTISDNITTQPPDSIYTDSYYKYSSSYTADKLGFVYISSWINIPFSSSNTWFNLDIIINNIGVTNTLSHISNSGTARLGISDIFPVNKNDIVKFLIRSENSATSITSWATKCYYIPPIFITNEEMMNTALINRPDMWTIGVEYNFGNNLYGQRFVKTLEPLPTSVNSMKETVLDSTLTNINKIVSWGGYVLKSSNDFISNIETTYADGVGRIISLSHYNTYGLILRRVRIIGTNTDLVDSCDVWVKYTKN
jgi:hypothetical protein